MLNEEELIELTHEYYYKYKKILLLLDKIGFVMKDGNSTEWYYKEYYFVFMHSMNGNIGIYDTLYLNKQVDVNFYHNNPNHFSGLRLICTSTDNSGNEVYELNYFEIDIHYLTESDDFQNTTNKIISQLKSVFRKELRSLKLKKLYQYGN